MCDRSVLTAATSLQQQGNLVQAHHYGDRQQADRSDYVQNRFVKSDRVHEGSPFGLAMERKLLRLASHRIALRRTINDRRESRL
jgi:hypothetical protein